MPLNLQQVSYMVYAAYLSHNKSNNNRPGPHRWVNANRDMSTNVTCIHARAVEQKITLTVTGWRVANANANEDVKSPGNKLCFERAAKRPLPGKIHIYIYGKRTTVVGKAASGRSLTLQYGVSICHATWQVANLFKRILSTRIHDHAAMDFDK